MPNRTSLILLRQVNDDFIKAFVAAAVEFFEHFLQEQFGVQFEKLLVHLGSSIFVTIAIVFSSFSFFENVCRCSIIGASVLQPLLRKCQIWVSFYFSTIIFQSIGDCATIQSHHNLCIFVFLASYLYFPSEQGFREFLYTLLNLAVNVSRIYRTSRRLLIIFLECLVPSVNFSSLKMFLEQQIIFYLCLSQI